MSGKREEKGDQKKEGLMGMERGSVLPGKQVARFLKVLFCLWNPRPKQPPMGNINLQGFARPLGSPKKGVWMKQRCCEWSEGVELL